MSSKGHIFFLALLLASLPCFSKTVVTYPQQMFSDGYPIALLKLALDKSELRDSYVLEEASVDVQQGRSLLLLRKQIEIDVAWSMTSNEREKGLRAIKIPIYKGLYGYRLFLIHEHEQSAFPADISIAQLQEEKVAIQGHDWPDTKVLMESGYKVQGALMSDAMFELLQKGRVDYFPTLNAGNMARGKKI